MSKLFCFQGKCICDDGYVEIGGEKVLCRDWKGEEQICYNMELNQSELVAADEQKEMRDIFRKGHTDRYGLDIINTEEAG
jgi:hypothetical protein